MRLRVLICWVRGVFEEEMKLEPEKGLRGMVVVVEWRAMKMTRVGYRWWQG